MPRRIPPPPPTPVMYRVLATLEDGHGGFYAPGTILQADQVARDSLLILLERGVIMFHLDPAQVASLPDHD